MCGGPIILKLFMRVDFPEGSEVSLGMGEGEFWRGMAFVRVNLAFSGSRCYSDAFQPFNNCDPTAKAVALRSTSLKRICLSMNSYFKHPIAKRAMCGGWISLWQDVVSVGPMLRPLNNALGWAIGRR